MVTKSNGGCHGQREQYCCGCRGHEKVVIDLVKGKIVVVVVTGKSCGCRGHGEQWCLSSSRRKVVVVMVTGNSVMGKEDSCCCRGHGEHWWLMLYLEKVVVDDVTGTVVVVTLSGISSYCRGHREQC